MTLETRALRVQRYRFVRVIARGGIGEVVEVYDERERRTLASKQLLSDTNARNREELASLFRNEYSTLAQFAHPNVVKVYDFGVDQSGSPFYTMELVQGEHPGANGPMPWRDVCRLLVTLCGPLALLHSRGWVHRDVSPRNVYVTADGTPKLLDFGAIAALDAAHRPMGTPACMAPETLRRQRIDARTDLYGLAALGYCALTGRHAYPARTLEQLSHLWQTPPPKPSDLVPSIPEALDELILSMLCLDMNARPRQLAEVVARLSAVADLPLDGERQLAQACLTTPGLVGRDEERARLRELLHWAMDGRSATCVVRGEHGSGCTRLLDSVLVDAKVLGYTVMRANAMRCNRSDFALARELASMTWAEDTRTSLEAVQRFAAAAARLDAADGGESERLDVQRSFIALCEHCCAQQPLLIVIDDLDTCDAESLRLLLQLQRRTANARCAFVFSQRPGAPAVGSALFQLLRDASVIELGPLDAANVETLMRSLFGDVPNLTRVAEWVRRSSRGQFAACINAAKALVESGQARFSAGTWHLPDRLAAAQPTATARVALDQHIARLSTHARALLHLLALVNDPPLLPLVHYRRALPVSEPELMAAESELITDHVLVTTPSGYVLADAQLLVHASARMTADELTSCHERLAAFYLSESKALYAAYHFWQAGQLEAADLQLRAALDWRGSVVDPDTNHFARAGAAIPLFEAMLQHRKQRGSAPAELFVLRMALLTLAALRDLSLSRYAPETMAQLRLDAGLDFWETNDPAQAPTARIMSCLGLAKQRYAALPAHERGLPPDLAVRGIGSCAVALTGVYPLQYDVDGTTRTAALVAPIAALSPTLELVSILVEQSRASITFDSNVRPLRKRAIDAAQRELPGLSAQQRESVYFFNSYYQAMDSAAEGQPEALETAAILESKASFQPLALQVRRTHALACGDFDSAQRYRRERELLPFSSETSDQHLQMSLLRELGAAYQCHDPLELTRCTHALRLRAAQWPGWQPWVAIGQATSHLLADEPNAALDVIERGLAALAPFGHAAWLHLIRHRAEALIALRRYAEARRSLIELLADIEARGLSVEKRYLFDAVLGVAETGCGEHVAGLARLDRTLAELASRLGRHNVMYGMLCENRCQASLIVRDYKGFAQHVEELAEIYAGHPALLARHARWVRDGQKRFHKLLELLSAADARNTWVNRLVHGLPTQGSAERSQYLLSLVLEETAVEAGQLFRIDAGVLQLMAARPSKPDPLLVHAAEQCLASWFASDNGLTAPGDTLESLAPRVTGTAVAPLWLTNPLRPDEPIGLVLLTCPISRLARLSPAFVRAIAQHIGMLQPTAERQANSTPAIA